MLFLKKEESFLNEHQAFNPKLAFRNVFFLISSIKTEKFQKHIVGKLTYPTTSNWRTDRPENMGWRYMYKDVSCHMTCKKQNSNRNKMKNPRDT